MIPASYLFDQAYRQAWHEPNKPEMVTKDEADHPRTGLLSPLIDIMRQIPRPLLDRHQTPDLTAGI